MTIVNLPLLTVYRNGMHKVQISFLAIEIIPLPISTDYIGSSGNSYTPCLGGARLEFRR